MAHDNGQSNKDVVAVPNMIELGPGIVMDTETLLIRLCDQASGDEGLVALVMSLDDFFQSWGFTYLLLENLAEATIEGLMADGIESVQQDGEINTLVALSNLVTVLKSRRTADE